MRRSVPWFPVAVVIVLGGGLTACASTEAGTASPATSLTSSRTIESPSVSSTSSTQETTTTAAGEESSNTVRIPSSGTESTAFEPDPSVSELASRMGAGFAATSTARGSIDVYDSASGTLTPVMSYGQETDPDGAVVALDADVSSDAGESTTFRWVDGRFFLGGTTAESYGATWLEITTESTTPGLQDAHTSLEDAIVSASMSQYVEYLSLARDLTDGGPLEIGGTSLHWYLFVLDLDGLDDASMAESARAALAELRDQGLTHVQCEYRLDSEGRLHYVQIDLDDSASPTSIIATYSDFDTPMDIAAPDPAEVVVAP